MDYIISDKKFNLNYTELVEIYKEIVGYTDSKFLKEIPKILHFICIVSYLKSTPTYLLMGDDCLVHELTHIMCGVENIKPLNEIREDFNLLMKLS